MVETSSHTSSPSTRASLTTANVRPFAWGSIGVVFTTTSKTSDTRTGRCTTIRFDRCTSPTAGNGKRPSVINAMCSGNAGMCRYVAGSVSRSVKPHTLA
jgi:hypothetical protein